MLYASDAQEIEGIGSSFRPSRWLHANELALQLLPTFGDLLFLRFENVDWSCGRISQATLASLVNVSLGFLNCVGDGIHDTRAIYFPTRGLNKALTII